METITIRRARQRDIEALCAVMGEAFGREGEREFMARLWADDDLALTLVAEDDGRIVGGVAFSRATLRRPSGIVNVAWLSPIGVLPDFQRRGIGEKLLREGLRQCQAVGFDHVVVLGDVPYYARFGFTAAAATALISPRAGANLLALSFDPSRGGELAGTLLEPVAFRVFDSAN